MIELSLANLPRFINVTVHRYARLNNVYQPCSIFYDQNIRYLTDDEMMWFKSLFLNHYVLWTLSNLLLYKADETLMDLDF